MTGRDGVLILASVAGMALTGRLGLWQLDRAEQKLALQAELDRRGALPPLAAAELAQDAAAAEAQVHRRATVTGRWRPELTVHLDNRQMGGRVGFFVLTPLLLPDGSAVVVQRGWRPRDFQDRTRLAPLPTPEGPVALSGRLARGPARLYAFDGADAGPIRQNLDLDTFARETGLRLRPVSLLQESPAGDGLQRDWPRPAADVHKHYGYAFQWFALCALIGGLHVWFRFLRPRRHRA
jgi:surfeit locus 1 family protein